MYTDKEIIASWETNASSWINAIKTESIESRALVTNRAILDTVLFYCPKEVLDVGCGEGWLVRELCTRNTNVFGIDVIPELIHYAKTTCHANFDICAYDELSAYKFPNKFDCVVCNFSLIGNQSSESVITSSLRLLEERGRLIIQTLHPIINSIDAPYKDGWRPGSWDGFSSDFVKPAPWYFRTIESWCCLLTNNGFQIKIKEPLHPKTGKPASIIFDCMKSNRSLNNDF